MRNYQLELEKYIAELDGLTPRLLLHSCCAPCSSYVIEYLSRYFGITVFYYNPNIYPDAEYYHRVAEQKEFISCFPTENPVGFIEGEFDKARFYAMAKGREDIPEGGARCRDCYSLRLEKTAALARDGGFDCFATTLTISPLKSAEVINSAGAALGEKYGVSYLASDFKKKNGFKRSSELSREYGIYRQDYCGCEFSRIAREKAVRNENG